MTSPQIGKKKMKWFIVVVMMWQPSGHTPLWIPYVSFETEECISCSATIKFFLKIIEQ